MSWTSPSHDDRKSLVPTYLSAYLLNLFDINIVFDRWKDGMCYGYNFILVNMKRVYSGPGNKVLQSILKSNYFLPWHRGCIFTHNGCRGESPGHPSYVQERQWNWNLDWCFGGINWVSRSYCQMENGYDGGTRVWLWISPLRVNGKLYFIKIIRDCPKTDWDVFNEEFFKG